MVIWDLRDEGTTLDHRNYMASGFLIVLVLPVCLHELRPRYRGNTKLCIVFMSIFSVKKDCHPTHTTVL